MLGRIGFQFGRGQDLCQEEPIAQTARDQVGVLAHESDARALGQIALQDGPGVDIPERSLRHAGLGVEELREGSQGFLEQIVVVGMLRVAGHHSPQPCVRVCRRAVAWIRFVFGSETGGLIVLFSTQAVHGAPIITHRQGHDAANPGQHPRQIGPLFRRLGQPGHFGMTPFRQRPLEVRSGGWRLGRGHSASVEAQLGGPAHQGCLEPGLGRGPGAHRPSMRRSTLWVICCTRGSGPLGSVYTLGCK